MHEEILDDGSEKISLDGQSRLSGHTLRSEMAQEIISRQPGFLEKWALLIFFGILLLIFGGTWFVHYPDVITARAILTAENNPKEIIVKQEGRLVKLFVKNNQKIKKSNIIGLIESEANYNQVIELSRQLEHCILILNTNKLEEIFYLFNKPITELGELQQSYQQFLTSKDILKDYNRSSKGPDYLLKQHQQKMVFQRDLQSLKYQVDDWVEKHVLQASTDGTISFVTSIEENKYLRKGALLGYIVPDDGRYYAEAVLPQNNFGKIDTGLHVQLRFDAYSYEEWGFVGCTISHISNVPTRNGFLITIKLDSGLITSNRQRLAYKNGLSAQAIIITKDMRLLERFYYGFVKSTSIDK